jgi:phosphoribosylanthranilate isomerase
MSTQAKICGLNTPEAVAAAQEGGAAYAGFVIFPRSPRHVAPEAAARLAAPLRQAGGVQVVALTVDPDDEALSRLMDILDPDLIQLHGAETPERTAAVRARFGRPVIKAVSVRDASDIAAGRAYEGGADHLLFDARPPLGADRPGGHGARFDWTLLEGLKLSRPWFLAGGLDPWNVGEAIAAARAPLVDVSSGVERGPGVKDPGLIGAFLKAVRQA